LITGVKSDSLKIEDSVVEDYFLGVLVRHRMSNFRFWIINVYGPAQHEFPLDFIQGLSRFCTDELLPILMGGDFNLIRSNRDRNQGQGD